MDYRIVAGLMALELMALFFKQKNKPPSVKGIVETVHSLPGRIRMVVPSLVDNPEPAANLQISLGSLDVVCSVRVSPVSGSVLVRFDPASVEPVLLFGAVIRMLGLENRIGSAAQPVLWREIDAAGKTVDEMVRSLSVGLMDIKTLTTLLLAGVVGHRFFSGRTDMRLPATPTLVWWIANLVILRGAQ